jgi:hypothetical protein
MVLFLGAYVFFEHQEHVICSRIMGSLTYSLQKYTANQDCSSTAFRSAVKSGVITDSEVIISAAIRLDQEIVQVFDDAPPGWSYESIYNNFTDCDLVFGGSYDIYHDHWVAFIWNSSRCIRVGLNEIIRVQLVKVILHDQPIILLPHSSYFLIV